MTDLARDGLAKKSFTSLDLTDAHITAIEAARVFNAFVMETPDQARSMARAADAKIAKGEGGPLGGIPLGIKDLFATQGVRTTACSRILGNFVPPYESAVTSQLWRDGAVLLGKLNNDEFAMGSSNETSCFGPVVNPWRRDGSDTKLVPGRLIRRIGIRGGGWALPRRNRNRHRRLDPSAGGVCRHRRHEADLRPLLALEHRRIRLLARSGRTVRAYCRRPRSASAKTVGRIRSRCISTTSSRTVNMAGLPGIAVSAGKDAQGLPLGLQLIGRPFDEEALFSLGEVIEQAAGRFTPPKWWA
ncbi:MAG: aspartyl-tRNA(Asn)/glutamyl-tRNA(Gln) amidotransferase subunit [Bradyrhizobium sp.]|nr:aspartyl-tRNA(Asn)/glutamyl-tRNA(Gln) amidotransferase subunit [Bradyrhizobium sp.]